MKTTGSRGTLKAGHYEVEWLRCSQRGEGNRWSLVRQKRNRSLRGAVPCGESSGGQAGGGSPHEVSHMLLGHSLDILSS